MVSVVVVICGVAAEMTVVFVVVVEPFWLAETVVVVVEVVGGVTFITSNIAVPVPSVPLPEARYVCIGLKGPKTTVPVNPEGMVVVVVFVVPPELTGVGGVDEFDLTAVG